MMSCMGTWLMRITVGLEGWLLDGRTGEKRMRNCARCLRV